MNERLSKGARRKLRREKVAAQFQQLRASGLSEVAAVEHFAERRRKVQFAADLPPAVLGEVAEKRALIYRKPIKAKESERPLPGCAGSNER